MKTQFAIISGPLSRADRRRSRRRVISFGLDVAESRADSPLLILDVSEAGMQIQTTAQLGIGESVIVELPEAGSVEAKVRWRTRDRYGARFTTPISQAAISAIQLASPARVNDAIVSQDELVTSRTSDERSDSSAVLYSVLALACLVVVAFLYAMWSLPISGT